VIIYRIRSIDREPKVPALCEGLLRIVPFQVTLAGASAQIALHKNVCTHRLPIIQIDCLPIWVIPWPEGSPIDIKLVREHKVPLLGGVLERGFGVCALGSRRID